MKNKYKGINAILTLLILCLPIGSVFAQAGPTGIGTRNPQGSLHIDGAKDNPITGAPTATQAANDVIISKTTGFVGVGVLSPIVPLDMRSSDTENALGLGTTTMTASAAAAGAVRYDTSTGPALDVSDNTSWKRVYVAPQKVVVVARKITGQLIPRITATTITNWSEVQDLTNSFNPTTGEFTAPRNGTYTFLLTFDFASTVINDGSLVESQIYQTSGTPTILASVYKTFGQSMTGTSDDANQIRDTQVGGSSTVTLTLAAGAIVVPRLYHTLVSSGSVPLRITTNSSDPANPDDGFNNLTIIEH